MLGASDTQITSESTTGLIQVGWPGGMLTLRYTGIPNVNKEARDEIKNIMQQFSADCQMMLVWFVGTLNSRGPIRQHLGGIAQRDEPLTINSLRPDGRVESVFAQVPIEKVIDAFSDAGEYERLYAKTSVVFTFQIWEEVARPMIAGALNVKPKHIEATLMGDWRRLRNWLVHRTAAAERDYFNNAGRLVHLLESQPNEPSLTADKVLVLMQQLNRMSMDVNPNSAAFGLELVSLNPQMIAEAAKTLEPRAGIIIPPEAAMFPSSVFIILNSEAATIHELDCSQKDIEFKNDDDARWLRVSSFGVAREVIKHLGRQEYRCEHCRPSEE